MFLLPICTVFSVDSGAGGKERLEVDVHWILITLPVCMTSHNNMDIYSNQPSKDTICISSSLLRIRKPCLLQWRDILLFQVGVLICAWANKAQENTKHVIRLRDLNGTQTPSVSFTWNDYISLDFIICLSIYLSVCLSVYLSIYFPSTGS